jgi:adenylosuccinate lyase
MSDPDANQTYQSPYSWRYGSTAMRALWSEIEKRRGWRRMWVALAEAQVQAGLVSPEQAADLRGHMNDIDIARALEIEAEIGHDVMAEIRTYAEQCPVGGGIIHLGATSMDISDNAEVLRQRDALDLVLEGLDKLLAAFAGQIERWADIPCIAWTHLQPAEPTTVGYRLAMYAQDLLADREDLRRVRTELRGKGIKGAVGTAASYTELLVETSTTPAEMEAHVMTSLDVPAFTIAGQTYPRRQDLVLLSSLAAMAASIYRFAFDLRVLQSAAIGEWAEPFGEKQVGSSAMPFKRNPVNAEKLDSLGRFVASLPAVAWNNAAHCLLERTLDDSANRRTIIPEAFLAIDEMLTTATRLVSQLKLDKLAIANNMARWGVFAATERVLMTLSRSGADRQVMHERMRQHSLAAWGSIQRGEPNPLVGLLIADAEMGKYLPADQIKKLMDASVYVGDAPERARVLASRLGG